MPALASGGAGKDETKNNVVPCKKGVPFAREWLLSGTTTIEAKTGYHLTRDGELAVAWIPQKLL